VPVGRFAALKPGGRAAVFADAEAAHVKEPSAHKVDGVLATSARCKTAPGDESAARTPNGAVAAFADTAAGVLALEPPRATRLFQQDCHSMEVLSLSLSTLSSKSDVSHLRCYIGLFKVHTLLSGEAAPTGWID
jgi:hypothetical protein